MKLKRRVSEKNYSIYGDNILECERLFLIIKEGFPELLKYRIDLEFIYAPKKIIFNEELIINIQFYPDYKSNTRWNKKGILTILEEQGSLLTEAPDVILTETVQDIEKVILAIEFSSALPAGNQAWQRSGRALSFSEASIPYLYFMDLGLEELDSNRKTKATRSSNPLVPLSYLRHTERNSTFALAVLNPSQILTIDDEMESFLVGKEVVSIVRGLMNKTEVTCFVQDLIKKTASYLDTYNGPKSIVFSDWINLKDKNTEAYLKSFNLKNYIKKVASKTPLKPQMRNILKDLIPEFAISIYNDLPICFIPSNKRKDFALKLKVEYPNISNNTFNWLKKEEPLTVCLINGFKPKGDDARPDRGLVPFGRMLFGYEIDLLSIVFGQAPQYQQTLYKNTPKILAKKNGLWNSILCYSSLTIADSTHWKLKDEEVATFCIKENGKKTSQVSFEKPPRTPIKFKENDIDTAIHITFSSNNNIFESLCNPPGGDWSGISLLDQDNTEHRWMSLPRVSIDSKRPDHIFEFDFNYKSYLLIIESKERLSGLLKDKEKLGVELKKYLSDLLCFPANALKYDNNPWIKNRNKITFNKNYEQIFSAAAFFCGGDAVLKQAKEELNVDMLITFDTKHHKLNAIHINNNGLQLISILNGLNLVL